MSVDAQTFELAGRVAVVTGGAQGIGAAIATALAAEGARVCIADLAVARAEALVSEIAAGGGHAAATALDVSDPASVAALPAVCEHRLGGPPQIVVANAGIQTFTEPGRVPVEEFDRVMEVNARGVELTLEMAYASVPDGSAVVTIASLLARTGAVNSPHYAASKAAVLSLTRSYAMALARRRVRVNAVAPGMIDTALWEAADAAATRLRGTQPGQARRERIAQIPLGRPGTPRDVADAVLFLASPRAGYITGETLHVCGGDLML